MEIGKVTIDFKILPALDTKVIMVADNSDWFSAENLQSTILVTPPGSIKAITNVFSKHKINTFNSSNLGLNCVTECGEQKYIDLSDGIWKICVKSGYENIEKTRYFLKTDRFMLEWYKEWITTGLTYTDVKNPKYDALMDSKKHITSAEAYTLGGDYTSASREFREAQKKLNEVRKCKNCY
jgi:hypothetical protein